MKGLEGERLKGLEEGVPGLQERTEGAAVRGPGLQGEGLKGLEERNSGLEREEL